jgi:hypothetical protein
LEALELQDKSVQLVLDQLERLEFKVQLELQEVKVQLELLVCKEAQGRLAFKALKVLLAQQG